MGVQCSRCRPIATLGSCRRITTSQRLIKKDEISKIAGPKSNEVAELHVSPESKPLHRTSRGVNHLMPKSPVSTSPRKTPTQSKDGWTDPGELSGAEFVLRCQPHLLRLIPRAIRSIADALEADNPAVKLSAASKILEYAFGSRGHQHLVVSPTALAERREEKRLITLGIVTDILIRKAKKYEFKLPADLAFLLPELEKVEQLLAERRESSGRFTRGD